MAAPAELPAQPVTHHQRSHVWKHLRIVATAHSCHTHSGSHTTRTAVPPSPCVLQSKDSPRVSLILDPCPSAADLRLEAEVPAHPSSEHVCITPLVPL